MTSAEVASSIRTVFTQDRDFCVANPGAKNLYWWLPWVLICGSAVLFYARDWRSLEISEAQSRVLDVHPPGVDPSTLPWRSSQCPGTAR